VATYLLLPGAGGDGWYWHLVAQRLGAAGHRAIPVDLPAADPAAGLPEYVDAALDALNEGGRSGELVVVAQSLGGFTAPLVTARTDPALLVLVNAMAPAPGEPPGQWWANTGHAEAIQHQEHPWVWGESFDVHRVFLHDLAPELVDELLARAEPEQSDGPFAAPWPPPGYPTSWPDVPTRFLQGRDDRFFPLEFQRRVVRERLGLALDEMGGGHLMALSRPTELVAWLETYGAAR
jgi:alpha/beta hydrolase family protein